MNLRRFLACCIVTTLVFGVGAVHAHHEDAPRAYGSDVVRAQLDTGGARGSRTADAPKPAKKPAADRWAVIIGINEYAGSTTDAIGSRQDAKQLYKLLRKKGWWKGHIRLLLDTDATANRIVKAFKWLKRKTNRHSVVLVHYAGHEMPFYSDPDGDGEYRDVAIWASDNRYVMDRKVGKLLGKVRAKKMWIHFATCRAGGFDDKGMRKKGRVITYSSPESELSYEDPSVNHSVFGYYSIVEGLKKGWGDRNGDGKVTVEEAFRFSKKRVERRTDGRQHPVMWDNLKGSFRLKVPKPKKSSTSGSGGNSDDCILGICP